MGMSLLMKELNDCGGGLNEIVPIRPHTFESLDTCEWNSMMGLQGLGGVAWLEEEYHWECGAQWGATAST